MWNIFNDLSLHIFRQKKTHNRSPMIEHLSGIVTVKSTKDNPKEELIHERKSVEKCLKTFWVLYYVSWFIQYLWTWFINSKHKFTLHESDDTTKNGEDPERRSKDRSKVKNGTKEPADKKRILPAKLVRYGTHANATNKKSEEDHRGWDESKWTTFADKVKLGRRCNSLKHYCVIGKHCASLRAGYRALRYE